MPGLSVPLLVLPLPVAVVYQTSTFGGETIVTDDGAVNCVSWKMGSFSVAGKLLADDSKTSNPDSPMSIVRINANVINIDRSLVKRLESDLRFIM